MLGASRGLQSVEHVRYLAIMQALEQQLRMSQFIASSLVEDIGDLHITIFARLLPKEGVRYIS